jgi:bacillithiol biosynthesis cysteine-adding enzyme BshC
MESSCVRQNLIPGTSQIYTDYLYEFDRVERFFPYSSWDSEQVVETARQIQYPAERRGRLVAALREQNGDSPALEKLAREGTVAVVTGQQVGFLTGPAYTVFKALTAVKLAAHLNEQGVAAVPVFWLASEDHDFAEVDHAWVFNEETEPARIGLTDATVTGGPVGDVVLNAIPIEDLRSALGSLPFAVDVMRRVEAAYYTGATLGGAFRKLVGEILQGLGLLFLDPLAPAIREITAPFLRDAVDQLPELVDALHKRNAELGQAGYHAQVHVEKDASLLFLLSDGRRTAIRRNGSNGTEHFVCKDRTYSAAQLKTMAARLSPNALLRPVMQDYLLPTASYVGGPAEIAYMAQGQVLYQRLLGRMPVIYPRNGFTLLDDRSSKLLDKYGLHLPDVLDHQEKVRDRMAAKLVPAELAARLSTLQAEFSQSLTALQADLRRFDPTLEAAAQKSAAKVEYQVQKLSRKTARETLRRNERASKDADFLIHSIYPHKHLQERFYSILPFLAKYGWELPQELLGMVQLSCPDHMIRTI